MGAWTTRGGNFSNKIFMSDKAHFLLGGYVNRQNFRILCSEKIHAIEERPLHTEKVTVWCALWCESAIGPYFFENDDGTIVTVNSESYCHMITYIFVCYWRMRLGEYVVSTRRCHVPRNLSEYDFIAGDISWPGNFSLWQYQLATIIIRFDPIRLFCRLTRKIVFMQIKLQL